MCSCGVTGCAGWLHSLKFSLEHGAFYSMLSPYSPSTQPFDVAIIGLGYVGLPTALTFHAAGARVLGIDVSTARLKAIHAEDVDLLDSDRVRLGAALQSDGLELTADVSRLGEAAA